MNSVLTRQSPNTPALDCVVQPDSLEQLHLSHLLVSRRAVRLATPGSLSGVLVYAEGGAISEDQNASKWGQFRRSNLPRSTRQRRTRSSDVCRVWSAAKRIAGARLQPRMATMALISTICS